MMFYKLKVTKQEENPQYEARKKEWSERQRTSYIHPDDLPPEKTVSVNYLEVVLDEAQWKAVQEAVLKTFK